VKVVDRKGRKMFVELLYIFVLPQLKKPHSQNHMKSDELAIE
jgi:hypothetical protein